MQPSQKTCKAKDQRFLFTKQRAKKQAAGGLIPAGLEFIQTVLCVDALDEVTRHPLYSVCAGFIQYI